MQGVVKDWTPADVESAFARTMTWIGKHKTQNAPTAAATESATPPQPEGMPDEKGKAEASSEALLNPSNPPAGTGAELPTATQETPTNVAPPQENAPEVAQPPSAVSYTHLDVYKRQYEDCIKILKY